MHHFRLPVQLSNGRGRINRYLLDEDWQSVIAEIECHPRQTRMWSIQPGFFDGQHESQVLPIHVACSLHAPLQVVRAIVEAYPECLEKKESSFKRLPIHTACQFAAPAGVIEYLAQENVAGTLEPDNLGRLPLHYACSNGASMEVVETLLRANPASVSFRDHDGWSPLHVAVRLGASTEVIRKMITVCPASVAMKTNKQSTPLKLAKGVNSKNRDEVIALLSGAGVTRESDASRLSPVHVQMISMAA
ncbi:hypothetical protein ACHAWF_006318 [Thalassiosira exigua]